MDWNLGEMSRDDLAEALKESLAVMDQRYQEARQQQAGDTFHAGRELAYFETLDILRSRIIVAGGEMDEVEPPIGRHHA